MALKDCSSAERLVVIDRFARFMDRLAGGDPGLERLLGLIEEGGESAPTQEQLDAFLALMKTDIDEPTIEELEAMFPKPVDGDETKPSAMPARGMSAAEALRMLKRLEWQGAVSVNVNERYINLWRREEDGKLGPAPIARISRDALMRVLSR
jgi:hypothetical protein